MQKHSGGDDPEESSTVLTTNCGSIQTTGSYETEMDPYLEKNIERSKREAIPVPKHTKGDRKADTKRRNVRSEKDRKIKKEREKE
jgi:hypothetical protein